ncbi:putative Endonuclease/exonuclease/phosphatase superfamily [Septoria linicola]|nr:putative Endonuclease/exonuclease/phosphatase superfamily [Septoria linicola]
MLPFSTLSAVAALCATAVSQQVNPTIAQINGNRYISPFNGQNVTSVRGLVTAKGPQGFWIRSTTPDRDDRTSESIYVFGREGLANATVGNIVTLDGRVTEFRTSPAFIFLTEIDQPRNIVTVSTGNAVVPLVIGQRGLNPPTEQYSSLDGGDVFAVPNNRSLISTSNPTLDVRRYGLDFWESLSGELVTVRRPRAVNRPNNFGDTWVAGQWRTAGDNRRGGLTITDKDANPEAILIGSPLDGTANPRTTLLGDSLEEITGVVTQGFGFYRILPTTNIKVVSSRSPALPPPTRLESSGSCNGITVGQYNVENLQPASDNLQGIASHIVNYLKTPDLLFLQEIQDNNGPVNDAVVSADITLSTLRDAVNSLSAGTNYSFVDIDPVDDQDGGQPGGNIRNAYFYKADRVRLVNGTAGSSTQANEVLPGPALRYNPGLIDPANVAWQASRKPIAAQWETVQTRGRGGTFFTFNNHWTSKGGSSSLHGDARPPVNGGVDQRTQQAQVLGSFIRQILDADRNANIMSAGDYNEFEVVQPLKTFSSVSGLEELDDAVRTPEEEKYTYLFDMNTQALDHMYVSPRLATRARSQIEHVHVNTWVSVDAQASDHDPSVSKFNVCR